MVVNRILLLVTRNEGEIAETLFGNLEDLMDHGAVMLADLPRLKEGPGGLNVQTWSPRQDGQAHLAAGSSPTGEAALQESNRDGLGQPDPGKGLLGDPRHGPVKRLHGPIEGAGGELPPRFRSPPGQSQQLPLSVDHADHERGRPRFRSHERGRDVALVTKDWKVVEAAVGAPVRHDVRPGKW